MMYDIVMRFPTAEALAEAFPCDANPRPPSWGVAKGFQRQDGENTTITFREFTVLAPQQVTPPYSEDPETGKRTYAYPPEAIRPGAYCTVSWPTLIDELLEWPEAVIARNRTTGEIVFQRTTNAVPLVVKLSPVWSGMESEFAIPPVSTVGG